MKYRLLKVPKNPYFYGLLEIIPTKMGGSTFFSSPFFGVPSNQPAHGEKLRTSIECACEVLGVFLKASVTVTDRREDRCKGTVVIGS